jgi:D-erythritol 1-phosphate dehydrogenase
MDYGTVDLAIIGGGVNGAGIARDAAGRGLKVLLCEKDDFAQGTSSRSSKLVHGGLRYLEYYEFRLVREALIEREILLNAAPHIIWPMRFVLPHSPEQRPAWLVRLGLFLYDHLGGRKKLPASRRLDLHHAPEGKGLKKDFKTAFEYSDCWVDDARLVVLNLLDAEARGAILLPRTRAVHAKREGAEWTLELSNASGEHAVKAKALVNAAGPWVDGVIGEVAGRNAVRHVRLIKGSHIIVNRMWDGPHAYLLQNDDKRVIFAIPYEQDFTLIGTTDIPYEGRPEAVSIDESEADYLLAAVNRYFKQSLSRKDIRHSYAGVRPLYDDKSGNPSAVTRDYVFDLDGAEDEAPLLSVFGGKITTYRKLAEHALEKIMPRLGIAGAAWTATHPLPGGDMPQSDFDAYGMSLKKTFPFLPPAVAAHYSRLYGTRTALLLNGIHSLEGLGRHFGGTLYEAEIAYLKRHEWAMTAEDILQRRTKHGLHLSAEERAAVETFLAGYGD